MADGLEAAGDRFADIPRILDKQNAHRRNFACGI